MTTLRSTEAKVPVSVIIPTFRRTESLLRSLALIDECDPVPAEIVVHVDGGDDETAARLKCEKVGVRVIRSAERVGPGGGRNRLVEAATHEVVASFDDDSYPTQSDYFARALSVMAEFPDAAIAASVILHPGEEDRSEQLGERWVGSFIGCGCIYRRSAFIQTAGFVPLRVAYGMEEVDLALRLMEKGWKILSTERLEVFHDNDRIAHEHPEVTAYSIANLALLTFLRYPWSRWYVGVGQVFRRLIFLAAMARYRGIIRGMIMIPRYLYQNREYRGVLTTETIDSARRLNRHPEPAPSA